MPDNQPLSKGFGSEDADAFKGVASTRRYAILGGFSGHGKTTKMIKINLRHLEEHSIRLKGELPVAELDFDVQDELVRTEKPLGYDLQVEQLHDSILVTGSLKLALDCECSRCLKPFQHKILLDGWALHLPLTGEDAVSIDNDCIDLTPFVREDMLLEFPQHPLCKPECVGLKKKARSAKAGQTDSETKPSPWTELNKLKF